MTDRWSLIISNINLNVETFKKSYKYINKKVQIKQETIAKHIEILIWSYNQITALISKYELQFDREYLQTVRSIFFQIREKINRIFAKYKINYEVPTSFKSQLTMHKLTLLPTAQSEGEESEDSDSEEVKLVMKAGNFADLNQAVRKFVECSTDQTGKTDYITAKITITKEIQEVVIAGIIEEIS